VKKRQLSGDGEALSGSGSGAVHDQGKAKMPVVFDAIAKPSVPALIPKNAERNWFALHTLSNHEKRVEQHLQTKGVETFLPLCTVVKRWKNRTTATVHIPLFSGYAFVHIASLERVRVLEVPGVLSLVGVAGKPMPLLESEIETLREGLHLRRVDPHPYLKVGNRARIRSGPLTGLEGVVIRKDDRLRIVLTLDQIMRSVAVHVEADELEPCNERHVTAQYSDC
jgi:transcription antitermination factor NusG